jgi:hypothetical protein
MVARLIRACLRSCATLVLLTAAAGAAPKREPPLLFGGPRPPAKSPIQLDPRLPTGGEVPATARRPTPSASLCSFTRPVCVHAAGVADGRLVAALDALEIAYERVILVLGLPAPRGDDGAGGSDALDWYLTAEPELLVQQEPLVPGRMDSAAVFCQGGLAAGELERRQASLCVGRALANALDAGEGADAQRALALQLWWITGAKTSLDVQVIDDAQRRPEQALAHDPAVPGDASGRFALLLEMLETTRSVAGPGVLSASLFSAAGSRTPVSAARFDNEPDVFDVLRHSVEEDSTRYADLLVDFSLRRALTGDRDDGTRLPTLSFAGSFARAHYDWVIPFSSLPRRVLSGRPIAQSGAELIWVDLDEAPLGAALGLRVEWEAPVAFKWRILLIDAEGREVRRMDVTFQERGSSADARVLRLDGAKAAIVAGVNLGGVELAHPFDPDVAPFEPAACTIYLVAM